MRLKLPLLKFVIILAFFSFSLFFFSQQVSAQCDGVAECLKNVCRWENASGSCDPGELGCNYNCDDEIISSVGCVQYSQFSCRTAGALGCGINGGSHARVTCRYVGTPPPTTYPIGYNCTGSACTPVYSGPYTYSSATCGGACNPAPPQPSSCPWYTNAGQCAEAFGSFDSGDGNGTGDGCCWTGQSSPPPPPQYGCSNNACKEGSGPYTGDAACAGNCGIKCNLSISESKVASLAHNSKLCGIVGENGVNNPSLINVSCNSEASGDGNSAKSWKMKKIVVPDLNGVGNNGVYSVTDAGVVSNNTVSLDKPTGRFIFGGGQDASNGNVTTNQSKLKFDINLTLTNPPSVTTTACSKIQYTYNPVYGSFKFTSFCGNAVNNQTQLRADVFAILAANGWGNFVYSGGNITESSSPAKANSISETFTTSVSQDGLTTTYLQYLSFSVPFLHDNLPVNGTICEQITSLDSTSADYIQAQISCSGNDTYNNIRQVLLNKFNQTGLRTLAFINQTAGTYLDSNGRIYSHTGTLTDITGQFSSSSVSYSNTLKLDWPDGVPYGSRIVDIYITDGTSDGGGLPAKCPDGSNLTCDHKQQPFTVDTSLPVVEREVTVDSSTLLKVVHKTTDDYQLKSHAVYCGPTAYSDSTSSNSAFITERRLSSDGLSYSYIGAQQIAGYFGADPNIKTCDGAFKDSNGIDTNNNDFKTFATTSTSDTRSTYYLLDENSLKNQNEPYEITFGDGKDGSALGRWYAEDSFCNMPASSPSTTVDIGSPWIQTKGGNAYVQGHSNYDNPLPRYSGTTHAYNYTVNSISFDSSANLCTVPTTNPLKSYLGSKNQKSNAALTSYVNRINQCPEKDDSYATTYALSTNEENAEKGPKGSGRTSKTGQSVQTYNHKLNNVSAYTGGDKALFEYLNKLIDTSGIVGYVNNSIEVTNTNSLTNQNINVFPNPLYPTDGSLKISPKSEYGGNLIENMDNMVSANVSTNTGPNSVKVYKINTDLIIEYNTANDGVWQINNNAIFMVDGDVILEPDIVKNGGSLVIVAKGSIVIGNGKYKSAAFTKDQVVAGTAYPLYDQIDAFLITDGKLITLPDKGGSSNLTYTSNPVKPTETVATKPEIKLNNELVKDIFATTNYPGYPCGVVYYKQANYTNPYSPNETVPSGQDLYLWISIHDPAQSDHGWGNVLIKNNGIRINTLHQSDPGSNQTNYYITIPGSNIKSGNNVLEFGTNGNYGDQYDVTTGYWCAPFILVGSGTNDILSGQIYCRDTNGNKIGVSGVNITYYPSTDTVTYPPAILGTSNTSGNWSGSRDKMVVKPGNGYPPYNYGTISPSHSNYLNTANRSSKASGCFNSNIQEFSFKQNGNNTLVDELNECGDSNQSYYQSTYTYGGETEDRNNMPLNSVNFDLGSCATQDLPTQCTAMTITNGVDSGPDVPITPGSDITITMTVINSTPSTDSGLIVLSNRDHKCNATRSYRAGLSPSNNYGSSYSYMDNSTNDPSTWQDCEPPATQTQTTTRFTKVSSVGSGTVTYTYKIKAEQLLKVDQNTNLPIKSIEFAGPNSVSESLRCKVYAHDNRIVYDGLKIYGGVVQTSTFPRGLNLLNNKTIDMNGTGLSSSLTCKNSGGLYPSDTNPPVNTGIASPCFLRDLIMVQNFVAPAEQIEYDASIQPIFGTILGRKSTLLSIRESTTND